jgi:hypothetical protein
MTVAGDNASRERRPGADAPQAHIEERLPVYTSIARGSATLPFASCSRSLLVVVLLAAAAILLLSAAWGLDPIEFFGDPELIALLVMGLAVAVIVARVWRWFDGWRYARRTSK